MSISKKVASGVGLTLGGLVLSLGIAASAHAEGTTAIDELETEAAKVTGVYDSVLPLAIGSSIFGVGMVMLKRIAFA